MIEDKSTCDGSATEVQSFQVFQFRNGRWDLCNTQHKSQQPVIMGILLA
jgi:hypothetical protein